MARITRERIAQDYPHRIASAIEDALPGAGVGFPANGTLIVTPFFDESRRFGVDPRPYYGFALVNTGGGCTALELVVDGVEYLLTDGEGGAPDEEDGCFYGRTHLYAMRDGVYLWEIEYDENGEPRAVTMGPELHR